MRYNAITTTGLKQAASEILRPENSNTLYYRKRSTPQAQEAPQQ